MSIRFKYTIRRYVPMLSVVAVAATGIICQSCEDDLLGVSTVVFPDSAVSFSRHVDVLFQQSCATSKCHGGDSPASQLNLEYPSYRALMDHTPRLVLPGDDANSLLILRLTGEVGAQMPFRQQPLTENQITGIRTWIDEGAINN